MNRSVTMLCSALLLALAACSGSPVGDPCVPENIPPNPADPVTHVAYNGFKSTERYLETSSVQCRTRVCIVNNLQAEGGGGYPADPSLSCETLTAMGVAPLPPNCTHDADPNQPILDQPSTRDYSVFCTCRCNGPAGGSYCQCPGGFVCTPVLESGGAGIVGSYCLRGTPDAGV